MNNPCLNVGHAGASGVVGQKQMKSLLDVTTHIEDYFKQSDVSFRCERNPKGSLIPGGVGVGMAGANTGAGNANNVRSNFQTLIQYYKDRFTQELKTTNNSNTPDTSAYYKSIMQGNSLTEPEKLAFRAQAYRIRLEVRNQMYGMGGLKDPKSQMYKGQQQAINDYKNATQGNINLLVENVVKVSGLYLSLIHI